MNTERRWRARGFRPMGRELVVDKWVADQAPPLTRLTGSTIHLDAGPDEHWSSSAELETIKACRKRGGLLLGVSTMFEPVSSAGSNAVLRYGAVDHIFFGRAPLTWPLVPHGV
ncbi:hypothetical protein [Streptomyces sp. NPDC039016]|uniref:hypothetical protein n=1 Tax=Streptomyces sp. NPDC039016 TaxID=3154330 RepID=UPI0033D75B45